MSQAWHSNSDLNVFGRSRCYIYVAFLDTYRPLKEPIFTRKHSSIFGRTQMSVAGRKLKKIALTEISLNKRIGFLREAKEELRQSLIEARAWRSLLEVDTLTINGIVLWKENQRPANSYVRRRRSR